MTITKVANIRRIVAIMVLILMAPLSLFAFKTIEEYQDSIDHAFDSIFFTSSLRFASPANYRLTEDDIRQVANELGVEVAAIHAVVDIEAGSSHSGFYSQLEPIINFDRKFFRSLISKQPEKIRQNKATYAKIMADAPNQTHQQRNSNRLSLASEMDESIAIQSTFWGMFQIGGFNWKKCGAQSPHQFAYLMSRSEHDQLELFAKFLINSDLVKYLKAKNWSAFAYYYNGPRYRSKKYHIRLAAAYKKHLRNND